MLKVYLQFKRKVRFLILSFFIATCLFVAYTHDVSAEIVNYDQWNGFVYRSPYNKNNDISIYRYKGKNSSLKIPETIKGHKVWGIDNLAFSKCKSLKSLFLPKTITNIGVGAISNSSNLVKIAVNYKNSKYTVKDNFLLSKNKTVLVGCPGGKKTINIPRTVKSIYICAFSGASNFNKVTLNKNIKKIDDQAFEGCKKLQYVSMSNSIKTLETAVFENCTQLDQINLSNNITAIEFKAFYNCRSLKKITIPNKVEKIEAEAFRSCTELEKISTPKNVNSIGAAAFKDCRKLKSITIYNQYCEIDISRYLEEQPTIPKSTVIIGYKDSTAEHFADKNGYKFKLIS